MFIQRFLFFFFKKKEEKSTMSVDGGCRIILIIIDVDFIDMSVLVCCRPGTVMGKPVEPFPITLWNSLAACMPFRVFIPPIIDTDIDKHIQQCNL